MSNPDLDELAKRLVNALPPSMKRMREDAEKNFRALLNAAFARMDLVTREEFDAQRRVLARTIEQLEALEEKLAALEHAPDTPDKTDDTR